MATQSQPFSWKPTVKFKLRGQKCGRTYTQRRSLSLEGTTWSPCQDLAKIFQYLPEGAQRINQAFDSLDCLLPTNLPPCCGLAPWSGKWGPQAHRIEKGVSSPLQFFAIAFNIYTLIKLLVIDTPTQILI